LNTGVELGVGDRGSDALPYFRDNPEADSHYPLMMFMSVREDEFFQTGQRHIDPLRKRRLEPQLFVNPHTAVDWNISEGEWAEVANTLGSI